MFNFNTLTCKNFIHVNLHGFRLFDVYTQPFLYTKQLERFKQMLQAFSTMGEQDSIIRESK
jgi:hypothetical protein